jgi:putative PIN family toxin of toxin-antitoxin system
VKRVTADSNIYISAYLRGGKPLDLVELARAKQIELAVSEDILSEKGRVLAPNSRWGRAMCRRISRAARVHEVGSPAETFDVVPADASDNSIVECAVEAGSDVIVTGEAHLLSLESFRGIRILRVSQFLVELAEDEA